MGFVFNHKILFLYAAESEPYSIHKFSFVHTTPYKILIPVDILSDDTNSSVWQRIIISTETDRVT
jgi:hypothetical protein